MEATKHKQPYKAPFAEVVEIQMHQMLCLSQTQSLNPKFGEKWTWYDEVNN